MNLPAYRSRQRFTWSDYCTWSEGERWELIDGEAFAMAPAPTTNHQAIVGRLYSRLEHKLSGKPCQPFVAPVDVRLSEDDVVQPDVLVICQPDKIKPGHIEGAPELVFEVLSPSTAARDMRDKKALYERCGVGEYIVVDPLEHYAIRYLLGADGLYDKGAVFGSNETLVVQTLNELPIALWEVFGLRESPA
ncbi:MAG: Uma2 family endonuclease [Rhodoferax sp.]|nr:Uma2 family endonuclease [Rhodoferax sp.]